MNSLMAGIFSDVPSQEVPRENHHARPPGGAPGTGGEDLTAAPRSPQVARASSGSPRSLEPAGRAGAGAPDAERPAGRGGVGQAGPWGGPVGRPARPQGLSWLASGDAVSSSDCSSLLGLQPVGDWVSRAVSGAGLQARPAHRRRGLGAAERLAGLGWRRRRRRRRGPERARAAARGRDAPHPTPPTPHPPPLRLPPRRRRRPARSCPRGRSEPGAPRGARDLGGTRCRPAEGPTAALPLL